MDFVQLSGRARHNVVVGISLRPITQIVSANIYGCNLCIAGPHQLPIKFISLVCTLCLKKDTDVAHYNFNAHQPISVTFGRNVAQRVCYQMVICYPTSPN